jgi:hypothetical protein
VRDPDRIRSNGSEITSCLGHHFNDGSGPLPYRGRFGWRVRSAEALGRADLEVRPTLNSHPSRGRSATTLSLKRRGIAKGLGSPPHLERAGVPALAGSSQLIQPGSGPPEGGTPTRADLEVRPTWEKSRAERKSRARSQRFRSASEEREPPRPFRDRPALDGGGVPLPNQPAAPARARREPGSVHHITTGKGHLFRRSIGTGRQRSPPHLEELEQPIGATPSPPCHGGKSHPSRPSCPWRLGGSIAVLAGHLETGPPQTGSVVA